MGGGGGGGFGAFCPRAPLESHRICPQLLSLSCFVSTDFSGHVRPVLVRLDCEPSEPCRALDTHNAFLESRRFLPRQVFLNSKHCKTASRKQDAWTVKPEAQGLHMGFFSMRQSWTGSRGNVRIRFPCPCRCSADVSTIPHTIPMG